ncbi:hypothetical protein PLICRDRAFT_481801 [Plicaturopsis crispa FD-325 SS-3]|nr:hypothetical protein PLICRDRAFT_481801 [Plicaturopsis crispa FD-325 SS-3]
MERSPSDQEREISELVRRAQKNPDRQGAQRRDALTRLIDLSHSRHSLLKSYAARHMHLFFGDFSDLEESVIDAVYDLCEDQMSRIRIEGYNAITQVSRARNKWIKRNADVLVQLLQSDDPDEVVVVKKALQEHLDMDPRITFGVLCDQITPVDEPMDDEDRQTRDRLRFLVLDFLTVYAKRNIVRYAGANSETEEVLVNGLLTAITKSSHSEVESIVKRLLVALPSYTPSSPRSLELLQHLLDLAKSFFRDESRVDGVKSLVNTRFHLGLAGYVSIEKKLVSPVVLLRFYVASFASKMTFDRLSEDDQLWITQHFAETLIACGDSKQNEVNKVPIEDIAAVRRQTVLASWNFFRILESSKMAFPGSWTLCKGLLQACNQEKSISKTPLPAQLFESVGKMQTLADSQNDEGKDETIREVQDLIRVRIFFATYRQAQSGTLCIWPHIQCRNLIKYTKHQRQRLSSEWQANRPQPTDVYNNQT